MTDVATERDPVPDSPPALDGRTHLGWAVAGLSAAAGVIHFAMVPAHTGDSMLDPLGFAAAGWFQLLVAGMILADRAGRNVYRAVVVGNLAVLGLWLWSRTTGLPFGSHSGVAEDVTLIDGVCAALQVGAIILAVRLLLAPGKVAVGRLAPALFAVAALALATTVITSSDAASHGGAGHSHGEGEEAADGHAHDGATTVDHAALMSDIDAARCDTDFNHPSYWTEAAAVGVDTYQGGAMATTDAGHDTSGATTTTEPDPTGGRGSATLDELISLTGLSSGGEGAAAALVTALSEASDEDYQNWLWWMAKNNAGGGGHHGETAAAAPGDSGGHGGHAGPQPWVALTDQKQCDQLSEEIDLARATALKYETAADAVEAGWVRVTPYVPGIAAHYMNFGLVDGEFSIEEPEMILYDGNEPDAHVVGLSYYLIHEGDLAPTQGFTGDNDHGHRHIGLCVGAGGVIGDSTTSEEDCAARGGTKSDGSNAWMSHAWVVPGCESPWGVFSAASPVLDSALSEESGENDGGCSASAVRDRYGLGAVAGAEPASAGG